MPYDIEQAALLWQQILLADTNALFGEECAKRLLSRNEFDRLPQPGHVGAKYNGLVFVSMNPGNGGALPSPEDLQQYPLLKRLRDAQPADVLPAFQQLNETLTGMAQSWRIYRMLVKRILKSAGLSDDSIAYVTMLPWRTEKRSGLGPLYRCCWKEYTARVLAVLQPRILVALGKGVGKTLESYGYKCNQFHVIERSIGDRRVPPAGELTIDRVITALRAVE